MDEIVATLKRGKYVHKVFEPKSGHWLYKNLLNQALLRAPKEEAEIIDSFLDAPNRMPSTDYATEIKKLLKEQRFLIDTGADELLALEQGYLRKKKAPALRSIAIVTTLQCNLRCEYCYQEHVSERLSSQDEDAIVNLIDKSIAICQQLTEEERPGQFQLTWWGGEPLLQIKRIQALSERIIPKFDAAGIAYSSYTSTNGVLLSRKNSEILKAARLRRAQITVDGPEPFHDTQRFDVKGRGTYRKVIDGVHTLCAVLGSLGRFMTLRVNVTPAMVEDSEQWATFFDDLSPVSDNIALNFNPAVPNDFYAPNRAIDNREFLPTLGRLQELARARGFTLMETAQEPSPGELYCGAIPDTNWIILPGRRLTKCTGKFHDRKSDCGRLEADGSIVLFEKASEWLNYSPFNNNLCRDCDVLPICMGGCRMIPFNTPKGDRCLRKTALMRTVLWQAADYTHHKGG